MRREEAIVGTFFEWYIGSLTQFWGSAIRISLPQILLVILLIWWLRSGRRRRFRCGVSEWKCRCRCGGCCCRCDDDGAEVADSDDE